MNNLQRITIVGFASAGMALFGAAAASADAYHQHDALAAGPHGAAAHGVKAHAGDDGHHGDHVFFKKYSMVVGPHGAALWATKSAAGD
ncbi:hypothetical protein [Actinomadura sp. 9N407]|uniref:hypothetical protein n=1 Tax=Actinomadura sp. 9N407 TaxID=3375154 RepID=UPI0037A66910